MKFVPRAYSPILLKHVLEVARGALFVPMGFGKTVTALNAIDILHMAGIETKPAIVFAPKRVAQSTWPDEAAKWDHLKHLEVQPIIGTAEERTAALRNTNAGIFTINYENAQWLMETLDGRWPFGMAVADESTKLKSLRISERTSNKGKRYLRGGGGSVRARAIAHIAHKCTRWLNLSGTPAPNGLIDLWGQLWVLDRGERLGRTFASFQARWFRNISAGDFIKIEAQPWANAEISERIKDICLSLRAQDYFDLKEPIVTTVMVELPNRARALYRDMEKEFFLWIEGHPIEAVNTGVKMQKCLQIASGAIYINGTKEYREIHDVKIQALESIVNESGGMPILCAYQFNSDLDRLKRAFPRARVLDDNPQTIRDWNKGLIPLLFTHPGSAGHGLSLQDGGNILVYFSIDWNLELHLQILERIGPVRQMQSGYDRPVFVYMILARDTFDEDVLERLQGKDTVQNILSRAMQRRRLAVR